MVILEKALFLSLIHFPKDGEIEYCGGTTENTAVNKGEKSSGKAWNRDLSFYIIFFILLHIYMQYCTQTCKIEVLLL